MKRKNFLGILFILVVFLLTSCADPVVPIAEYIDPHPDQHIETTFRKGKIISPDKSSAHGARLPFSYKEELYGEHTLQNFYRLSNLVADITVEGWISHDPVVEGNDGVRYPNAPVKPYTYFKVRVNRVWKGDRTVEGKLIVLAQNGRSDRIIDDHPLYTVGNRLVACLVLNKMERASIRNSVCILAAKYGVFDVVEYQGTDYAVKEFDGFADLTDQQVPEDVRQAVVEQKYKSGYVKDEPDPQDRDMVRRKQDRRCDRQVLELSVLEEILGGLE